MSVDRVYFGRQHTFWPVDVGIVTPYEHSDDHVFYVDENGARGVVRTATWLESATLLDEEVATETIINQTIDVQGEPLDVPARLRELDRAAMELTDIVSDVVGDRLQWIGWSEQLRQSFFWRLVDLEQWDA